MTKLKPCPICGGSAAVGSERDIDGFGEFYFVQCTKSGCRTKGAEKFTSEVCPIFMEEVRDAWNNRPYENKIKAQGVRGAVEVATHEFTGDMDYDVMIDYANKLEGGK